MPSNFLRVTIKETKLKSLGENLTTKFTFKNIQVPRSLCISSFKWVQLSDVLILKPGQNNPRYS